MKVKLESDGLFLPYDVRDSAIDITTQSLNGITTQGDKFIVNDTLYFRKQRTGKVTTCVMNSASYMSSRFQKNLSEIEGCKGETKIDGQNIDGLITKTVDVVGYKIKDKNDLLIVIHRYMDENNLDESSIHTLFSMFYGMYMGRGLYDISGLPDDVKHLFYKEYGKKEFRLGVEFETGNVASSFRAFNKLYVLFQKGYIDAGVFVTSIDKKNSATRIWPITNRNGSFQELRQRHYMNQVSLPLISIGFAPDGFDPNAQFLGKYGGLYSPKATGNVIESGSVIYEVYLGEDGEEVLKPVGM